MSLFAVMMHRHKPAPVIPPPPPPPGDHPLAIPRGAVSGYGTAADFYDSVGVNLHWKQVSPSPYVNYPAMVQDLANLGIRHVRDTVTGSWWSTVYVYYRNMLLFRNRNQNLPAATSTDRGQPIFQSCHTPGWTGNQPGGFGNDFAFTVADYLATFDGGRQHWQPFLNPRTPIANGNTSNPNSITPNPWAFTDPEVHWGCVGQITSANEPNNTSIGNLKPWTKQLNDQVKTRTTRQAFMGLPVATENGIRSDCTVDQIPVVGPSIINNGTAQSVGDLSVGTGCCDLGDQHPYHVGHEPSQEKVTKDLTQNGLSFNGSLASPPSASKSLPFVFTEWGQISRGVGNVAYPGAHDGYWPTPDDVIAEYAVRAFALFYSRGIRRTYLYEFYDTFNEATNPENNFGLLKQDRTKKAQFYAIRNLLRIVGFSEPADAARQKLAITVTGFAPRGCFYNSGSNTIVQDGSGLNKHYAMYSGQGDSGFISTGGVYHQNADRLDTLQLQQADDTWLLFIWRQVMLWDREVGNWNIGSNQPQSMGNTTAGRFTPDTQNLTVTLPAGVTAVSVATPTAGGTTTPDDGFAFSSLTITGNTVTVPMTGNLKVLKIVKTGTTPPPSPNLPIVVPSSGSTPAVLRKGSSSGARLQLKGVNVWGLQDSITTSFGTAQYNNRASIAAQIKLWGANIVRFRLLADDYNAAPSSAMGNLTKAQIVQRVKDWRTAVTGQGMYFMPCAWDPLDGAHSGSGWASNGFQVHQMFADIYAALGNDPMVIYEPFNEPNNVTMGNGSGSGQWDTNIRAAILYFREAMGYKGVLVIDPINWGNSGPTGAGYSDSVFDAIEAYDDARAGMTSGHQIVWAKHDYANNYNGLSWDPAGWATGQGGSQIQHLTFETEFGNYNGSAGSVSATWSAQVAAFLDDRFANQQNYVGGCAFLWGPWFDANAITTADNATPTTWGQSVKTNFLAGQPFTPVSGFTPGLHGSDTASADVGDTLNAQVMRVEFDVQASASSLDTLVGYMADRGIRCLLLAGFDSYIPTTGQAQNLGTWATRFGPGGTFWTGGRAGQAQLAVQHIEFGNETSFGYQFGNDGPGDASYTTRAKNYAARFKSAQQAIVATGIPVGLLCQADDGGSGNFDWINQMYVQVPDLNTYVSGFTIHPYGPGYNTRINNMLNTLNAHGASGLPIDITELGLATDNGNTLDDNYGWSPSMTYQQAADTMTTIVQNVTNSATIGPRLRHFVIYGAKDGLASGATTSKFSYFGVTKSDGSAKGQFTSVAQFILAG